jgi:hypothetical protein
LTSIRRDVEIKPGRFAFHMFLNSDNLHHVFLDSDNLNNAALFIFFAWQFAPRAQK